MRKRKPIQTFKSTVKRKLKCIIALEANIKKRKKFMFDNLNDDEKQQ